MFRLLARWRRLPFDYAALPEYMQRHGLLDPYRRCIAGLVAIMVASGGLLFFSPIGPTGPLESAVMIACMIGGAVVCALWLLRPWPTYRQSVLFVIGADALILGALISIADAPTALTLSTAFLVVGVYCGHFLPMRALLLHVGGTVGASTLLLIIAATSPGADLALLIVQLLVQSALFFFMPLMSQVPLFHLRDDAYRSAADPLTGVLNRRGLHQVVTAHSHMPLAEDDVVAALVIDLDGFKHVNDTLGHAGGDDVLRRVGNRLRAATDGWAVVARLGGEEFGVIAAVPASSFPDRFAAVHDAVHSVADTVPITASSGVAWQSAAEFRRDHRDVENLFRRADRVMYDVKRGGGDRMGVVHCPPGPNRAVVPPARAAHPRSYDDVA
ncbi:GGDEF domain-containing protein [Rhodococcoides corynebacterioides]|uniref:GGDEF domain-containing protein n=1 Tax=Rhodococcoides corynebacterioides TaxID=53972 RepID=A0ABS7P6S2_9NOCA|nr:GGDEF domain-containing protein [Rhodococcus corynebacterioides]MBY6368116.1 GGDEF domain-containing protein [Rhodococcus corynebacterioides]MBY6409601.1 GGDEF domain-containing protein [Rhodococcus corynebacterioides]